MLTQYICGSAHETVDIIFLILGIRENVFLVCKKRTKQNKTNRVRENVDGCTTSYNI